MISKKKKKTETDIFNENLNLVLYLAYTFRPINISEDKWQHLLEEYIQVGSIGLLKAIRVHNSKRGRISTIAWSIIRHEILRYIQQENKYEIPLSCDSITYPEEHLWEFLPKLTNTENQVIQLRIDGYTFKEIGQHFHKSKCWANQLFIKTIQKIKQANET